VCRGQFYQVDQIQWLSQFGIGAVFAGVMVLIYRADRKASEERLQALANDFKDLASEFREIVKGNTAAITSLGEVIRHRERD